MFSMMEGSAMLGKSSADVMPFDDPDSFDDPD
jgi:hypothetical protein